MATINAIGSSKPIEVAFGGTGAATLTNHGVLVGAGTSAVSGLTAMTNGQLVIGSTGADPVVASLTAGTGVTITPGAGTISIAAAANPARFHSYVTTTLTDVTGGGGTYTPVQQATYFDTASAYNNTNGSYVVPNTGVYLFGGVIFTGDWSAQSQADIQLRTTARDYNVGIYNNPLPITLAGYYSFAWTQIAQMTAGDLAYPLVNINGGTVTIDILGTTFLGYTATQFWGYQIA